jgi:hypothetical protein
MIIKVQQYLSFKSKMFIFRLCCFFLASGAFASPVNYSISNEASLSFDLKNVLITEVFVSIEDKTDVTFVFDDKISSSKQHLTLIVKNQGLTAVLSKISALTGFQFKKLNNTISVIKMDVAQ